MFVSVPDWPKKRTSLQVLCQGNIWRMLNCAVSGMPHCYNNLIYITMNMLLLLIKLYL